MVNQAQDWFAAGHAPNEKLGVIFEYAPAVFVILVFALLVHALLTRKRYWAVGALTAADRDRVRATIAEIEQRTSAEIVPLVLERSDRHLYALFLGALVFEVLAQIALLQYLQGFGSQLDMRHLRDMWLLELALFASSFGFTLLCPDYRRLFLRNRRFDKFAGRKALAELEQLTRGKEDAPALVLLFVSLFEHRVIVLASEPVAGATDHALWPAAVEAVLEEVSRGRLAEGLIAGMQKCAQGMESAFPADENGENHFPDRAITRRE
jgi:putative membrane protein